MPFSFGFQTTSVTFLAVLLPSFLMVSSCVTAPPKKPNLVEQVKKENAVGSVLAEKFESKLKFKVDPRVDAYLERICLRLSTASGDPRLAGIGAAIISDRGTQWRSFGLPGRQVYISLGILQKVQTDNEVAALIAIELGHIQQKQVLDHLQEGDPKRPDFFGPEGLFNYNEKELDAAIESAVGLLYKAGFDSRGVVAAWSIEEKFPEHSFYSLALLQSLIQTSRELIANYPPLRNPIVKTQEFMTIRKRIQKL